MKINTIAIATTASAFSLLFCSCKSKEEQVREEHLEQKAENMEAHANQVRKEGEKVADMKENTADAMRKNTEAAADATEKDANATRKATEGHADQIEKGADAVREQK